MAAERAKIFALRTEDEGAMSPVPFSLAQPFRPTEHRCKRRWLDYVRLTMDFTNTAVTSGPKPILSKDDARLLLRERFLLFVQCAESKVGEEPANPYLYGRYA